MNAAATGHARRPQVPHQGRESQAFRNAVRSSAQLRQSYQTARHIDVKARALSHSLATSCHHAAASRPRVRRREMLLAAAVGTSAHDYVVIDYSQLLSTMSRMVVFLLPLTTLVLSEPLLVWCTSLFIGQLATIPELAALGPANIIISFVQYVFISIQISAMGVLGEQLRSGDEAAAQQLFSSALGLSLICGVCACAAMVLFPEQLIVATGMRDPDVIRHASSYLQLRSVGQAALLISLVCQSAFLAQQDSLAPSAAGLMSTALALGGHVLLVRMAGWGLAGAAVATTVGNLAGAGALIVALNMRGTLRPVLHIPKVEDIRSLMVTMAPLTVTYLAKNLCYITIQTTATSILDVTRLAAHQAIFSAWGFCSFWVAPVERAILAMVPAAATPSQRRTTMLAGLLLGVLVGVVGGIGVSAVALFNPGILTHDPMLWPMLGQVAGQALFSMVCTGIDVCGCAINISAGEAGYVAQSFMATLVVVAAFMTACKHMGWGFVGIWDGICVFFAFRAVQSSKRAIGYHIFGRNVEVTEEKLVELGESLEVQEESRADLEAERGLGSVDGSLPDEEISSHAVNSGELNSGSSEDKEPEHQFGTAGQTSSS